MTYCPPNHAPQTYEFTALVGADLLSAGDTNLNCGDSFTMVSATAMVTVTDNDGSLSGDARRNELGDDRSWQTADIMIDGLLVEDDSKIYAEEYYIVRDAHGNCYTLIEIEVAHTNVDDTGDYFAFVGDVPPVGTELTVTGKGNVTSNWIDYRELSAGLSWDLDDAGKVTVEAEDMALRNYRVDDMHAASGGEVIKLRKSEGEATLPFGGEAGLYDLELAYVDENDGEGEIEVWVNGQLVHAIELDANNNGNGNDWSSISKATIHDVQLQAGDEIVLRGVRDNGEYARIDALTFCKKPDVPVDPPEVDPPAPGTELCIEFDTFADGTNAQAGDAGALVFEGVTFEAIRKQDTDGVFDDAMLFDSDAVVASGGDSDLLVDQGNLIIISEDGHSWDPDDNWKGGTVRATFDEPSTLTEIMIVDVEETGGEMRLYAADGSTLATIAIPSVGDGDFQWVDLGGVQDVASMEISMVGSGAVGAIKFIPDAGETPPPNLAPVALDDAAMTDEDTPVTLDLLTNDSDPDGDPLTVTFANGVAPETAFLVTSQAGRQGQVVVSTAGVLTFTPSDAFQAMASTDTDTVTVSYEITDGNGETATANATITVTGVNDGPDAVDDAYAVSESALATLDILTNDSDPEGDELTVTLLSQPIEGSVSLNANGEVIFDPGTDFLALGDGQTATVSFLYEISDGEFTDTATVTVMVEGEGVCIPEVVSTTTTVVITDPLNPNATPFNPVTTSNLTVELNTPEFSKDGTADISFSLTYGDLATEKFNFIYVIDVSGSTAVADSFEPGKTVMEAQIEALQALNAEIMALGIPDERLSIAIVPFSSTVQPVDFNPNDQDFNFVQFFGGGDLTSGALDSALDLLSAGGETNYAAAISIAGGVLAQMGGFAPNSTNNVYFLSDGVPFPNPPLPVQLEAFSAQLKSHAAVHAIGVGDLVPDTTYLDPLDNTGGASVINTATLGPDADLTAALADALDEAPAADSAILRATLSIFDGSGAAPDTFEFTGSDFDETLLGFELDLLGVTGLDPNVGATNTAELTVELDADGDGVADDIVTLEAEIEGLRPLSFDF